MGNGKESYVNHTWAMRAKGGLEEYRAPREVMSSLSDTWDVWRLPNAIIQFEFRHQ